MDITRKIELVKKAIGRLAAEVSRLVDNANYVDIAAMSQESYALNAWLRELQDEEKGA